MVAITKELEAFKRRHDEKVAQMRAINTKAEDEERDMTAHEQELFDALDLGQQQIAYNAKEHRRRAGIDHLPDRHQPVLPGRDDMNGKPDDADTPNTTRHTAADSRMMFVNQHNGQTVRALAPHEPLSDESLEPFAVGKIIAAMATNTMDSLPPEMQAAAVGGSDTAGGYLMTPTLSKMVVDLARANSVIFKAGAQTVPMDTSEMDIARVTADATTTWRAETVNVPASKPAFDRITLKAKTLAAIVPISIELLADAKNAPQLIQQTVVKALGAELDRAALLGTGAAAEPRGVRNQADVNTTLSVALPTNYAEVLTAIKEVLLDNYDGELEGLSWIGHPRDWAILEGLQDTTGQPMQMPPSVGKLRRLLTTSIPTTEGGGSDESIAIIGDFSQMIVGMRTANVQIEWLNSGSVTDGASETWNATDQLLRHLRIYLRADVALLRPTWFTVMSGIQIA